jgi:hypothetical protein
MTPRDVLAAALLNVGISDLDWWTSQIVKGDDEAATPFADAILAALYDSGWSLTRSEPDPLREYHYLAIEGHSHCNKCWQDAVAALEESER